MVVTNYHNISYIKWHTEFLSQRPVGIEDLAMMLREGEDLRSQEEKRTQKK